MDTDPLVEEKEEYPVEKGRYFVIVVFSFLSGLQCLCWFTFSSVPGAAKQFYRIDQAQINLLLNWGPIVFLPFVFVVSWMQTKRHGLRRAVGMGAWLTFACTIIRSIPSLVGGRFPQTTGALAMLHIGQILNAATGAVVMSLPSKLSAVWFLERERATATAVAYIANGLGSVVGFLLGPALVPHTDDFPHLLYVEAGLALLPVLGFHVYFPNGPREAPSPSAKEYQNGGYKSPFAANLFKALRNGHFLLVVLVGGVQAGVTAGWQGVLTNSLSAQFSPSVIGYLGFGNTLAGMVGGLLAGQLCDRFFQRRYKTLLIVFFALAVLTFLWFTLMLPLPFVTHPSPLLSSNLASIAASISLAGLFQGATEPLCYELTAELVYPVSESTSGALLVLVFNAASLVFLAVSAHIPTTAMNLIQTCSILACTLLLLFVRPSYRRADAERTLVIQ